MGLREKEDPEFRNSSLPTVHSVKNGTARVSLLPGIAFGQQLFLLLHSLSNGHHLFRTLILYNHQAKTLKALSLVTYGDSGTQTIHQ